MANEVGTNEYWSDLDESTRAIIDQSLSPVRADGAKSDQGSKDNDCGVGSVITASGDYTSYGKAVPTVALLDGNEFPVPSVCVVGEHYVRSLGMLPWFDVQEFEEDKDVDLYAVNGWLPGDVPLEWTLKWAWRDQFARHDGYLVRCCGESLVNVRAKFWEKAITGTERF